MKNYLCTYQVSVAVFISFFTSVRYKISNGMHCTVHTHAHNGNTLEYTTILLVCLIHGSAVYDTRTSHNMLIFIITAK